MGRHARLVVPGVALHVTQRGNNRQDCFRDHRDRLVYLSMLKNGAEAARCAIHAYCLMTNHVHLLLTPPDEEACSLMMRDLGRGYAAYFNRRHARTGSLWERPFKSCLVDSARYVLACYRYIECNPVRARMVERAADHPWSSYAGNAGAREDHLLTAHAEYLALGFDSQARSRAHQQLGAEGESEALLASLREATEAGYPLVGDRLKAELEGRGARVGAGTPGRRRRGSESITNVVRN